MGIRFTIARLIVINPMNIKKLVNPRSNHFFVIITIPTGPDTSRGENFR
jgi:hypothetical protein